MKDLNVKNERNLHKNSQLASVVGIVATGSIIASIMLHSLIPLAIAGIGIVGLIYFVGGLR